MIDSNWRSSAYLGTWVFIVMLSRIHATPPRRSPSTAPVNQRPCCAAPRNRLPLRRKTPGTSPCDGAEYTWSGGSNEGKTLRLLQALCDTRLSASEPNCDRQKGAGPVVDSRNWGGRNYEGRLDPWPRYVPYSDSRPLCLPSSLGSGLVRSANQVLLFPQLRGFAIYLIHDYRILGITEDSI
jgi:hypothetical protein